VLFSLSIAGKTTTLKILTGDELPSAGSAHLLGMDIIQNAQKVRKSLGYCPS
jgi:ATP-binding cassette, subfamily A (ABC1), member 3